MSQGDEAVALFEKFNCAQSVFAACAAPEEMSKEQCLAVAGAFGGGIGRTGEVCGAVTGALMVLGLRCGREMVADPAAAKGPLYARANAFMDEFKKRNGGLMCRELTGCDLRTAEGQEQFKSQDLHHKLCGGLVRCAAETLAEK